MKRKKQIFVLSVMFLLLLQNGILAQEYAAKLAQQREYSTEKIKAGIWPPVDAEWFYTVKSWGACFPCYFSYQNTKVIGDTLILSKECRILGKYNKPEICDNMRYETEFIYEENRKVYWYNRTIEQFTLLYDFSATTGALVKAGIIPKSRMLDLSSLKPGIYAIQLQLPDRIIHKQIIIKQ